ncbi:MAG TPA: diadenylate cyclase CdaA [Anaerolineales bacterium]|nr:diadenylate cyclase CdaA [Anaerolineales bacterium]
MLASFLENLTFIFQRLDFFALLDIFLVTMIFFGIMLLLRDTKAVALLRGVFLLIILISLLTSFEALPAFSWLVGVTLPALLISIPVIFAPEIRRGLERLGRAGALLPGGTAREALEVEGVITSVVRAAVRLSDRRHGALIVLQRLDTLQEYVDTGVSIGGEVTPELLLQIFYPNTPLHDGAVIVAGTKLVVAAAVLPLSASGILVRSPDRQMGLRHRAALGISEVSDAVAVVVSEENGAVSVAYGGRMIRRLDAARLENVLYTFYQPLKPRRWFDGLFNRSSKAKVQSQMEEKDGFTA